MPRSATISVEPTTMFDVAWVRFVTSGTLITCHLVANRLAHRGHTRAIKLPTPAWVHPLIAVSMLAFYALIGPTGGALLGGIGNLAGIALAGLAVAFIPRGAVRYPELASRSLFYVALPIAVGTPLGLLALSLPACAASAYCCHLADRARAEGALSSVPALRYRLVPGVW
jgi:hypothetical protein